MKALKKQRVGGGGDLRQHMKVRVKCRNDYEREDELSAAVKSMGEGV